MILQKLQNFATYKKIVQNTRGKKNTSAFGVCKKQKPFIAGLNNLFGKLADDEEFIYVSTHLQDDKEITEE